MKCTNCGFSPLKRAMVDRSESVAGHRFESKIPGLTCDKCGEVFYGAPGLKSMDLVIAVTLTRAGERSGEAMRFIRKAIGMPAKDLAELTGMTPEHVSRLENGKSPVSAQLMALLGSMAIDIVEGRSATREALQAMKEPSKLAKRVPIEVPQKWPA